MTETSRDTHYLYSHVHVDLPKVSVWKCFGQKTFELQLEYKEWVVREPLEGHPRKLNPTQVQRLFGALVARVLEGEIDP